MLARLMRALLLGQLLIGALLGGLLAKETGATLWLAAMLALAMPLVTLALLVIAIGIRSRAPGANRRWLRSLLFEYTAMLRAFVLQLPWGGTPTLMLSAPQTARRTPVLLVHGFLCNHRIWDAMTRRLHQAGHAVLTVDLEPVFAPIESYAALIQQAVAQLCQQTGATKVALVGHSMGGLAIRAWLRAYGSERANRVITLGTPHTGTQILRRSRSSNGQQMMGHSAWLQALEQSETGATRSLIRIALTPQDHIVYPQREQVLAGVPVTVFDGLGHVELSSHPAVIDWVLQQVADLCATERAGTTDRIP